MRDPAEKKQARLTELALSGDTLLTRLRAIDQLTDEATLAKIAIKDDVDIIGTLAAGRLHEITLIREVAYNARNNMVRVAAMANTA